MVIYSLYSFKKSLFIKFLEAACVLALQSFCPGWPSTSRREEGPRYPLAFSQCVCSVVSDFVTPWTVAHQAPLSMGFPRQEYWSGLLCPPRGHLPHPGIETPSPVSPPSQADLYHWATWDAVPFLSDTSVTLTHPSLPASHATPGKADWAQILA